MKQIILLLLFIATLYSFDECQWASASFSNEQKELSKAISKKDTVDMVYRSELIIGHIEDMLDNCDTIDDEVRIYLTETKVELLLLVNPEE